MMENRTGQSAWYRRAGELPRGKFRPLEHVKVSWGRGKRPVYGVVAIVRDSVKTKHLELEVPSG